MVVPVIGAIVSLSLPWVAARAGYWLYRVEVITRDRGTFVIAPREQDRFLDEVARRTPQLQRQGFGVSVGTS